MNVITRRSEPLKAIFFLQKLVNLISCIYSKQKAVYVNLLKIQIFSLLFMSTAFAAVPIIEGVPETRSLPGENYLFQPTASDVDNDVLVFRIRNLPSWATFDKNTGRLSGVPSVSDIKYYANINIGAFDGENISWLYPNKTDGFTLVVNTPPVISGIPTHSEIFPGDSFSFIPVANDPDGLSVSFKIYNQPPWTVFNKATGELSGQPDPDDRGSYLFNIGVTDGTETQWMNDSKQDGFTLNVVNTLPQISGDPDTEVLVGSNYSFQPVASDPDGDTLKFVIRNKPEWAFFNESTGKLSGIPLKKYANITFENIIIIAKDGKGGRALLPSFNITVVNHPPKIVGTPPKEAFIGDTYSFQPVASDPDGDLLSFVIKNKPEWMTFDTVTGKLSGVPSIEHTNKIFKDIIIVVNDGKGGRALLPSFNITIGKRDPIISGTPHTEV